jgi:hypothetical protein
VGDKNSPVANGIEVQIYASHGKPDNKLSDHDSGGVIPGIAPKKNAARPQGEWNHFHIINQGDKRLDTNEYPNPSPANTEHKA